MKIIADSGSTKTDWRIVSAEGKITQVSTQGFNPFFQTTDFITEELEKNLLPSVPERSFEDSEVFFYGAGCSSPERCETVKLALEKVFKGASVEIEHDLLGAARASCGREEGIAAILGTGSNTCLFDGKNIVDNIPNLGFIMGDEGSGARIGMQFLRAYMYREVPAEIAENFSARFSVQKEDILEAVYKKPMPSRFLASFSKFVFQNLSHPFCTNLVIGCFEEFFDRHIVKYPRYQELKFNCVGSVAFYYSTLLKVVAAAKGIRVGNIIETPIAGLTLYHTEEVSI